MSIFDLFRKSPAQAEPSDTTEQPTQTAAPQQEPAQEAAPADARKKAVEGAKRIHNLIILDESGSMMSIYTPALTGVNETLQTIRESQKENADQEQFVSLVAFDTSHYNLIYLNTPAEKAVDITKEQYRPSGGTPLYDAMGRSINELRKHVAPGDAVLVTVITDGYENSSREYTGKAIKALVEEMRKEGWIFTYIGANQDVEAVAASMSINNSLAFEANDEDTRNMFAKERRCRKNLYSKMRDASPDSCNDFSEGYFNE